MTIGSKSTKAHSPRLGRWWEGTLNRGPIGRQNTYLYKTDPKFRDLSPPPFELGSPPITNFLVDNYYPASTFLLSN